MTDMTMTCGELEARLADYLEGTLDAPAREAVERHLAACERCAELVAALDERPAAAASLPVLSPERDLWSGIAARIEPRVLPMTERRSAVPARRGWRVARLAAAAAVLIGATAVVTRYVVMHPGSGPLADVAKGGIPGEKPKTPGLLASQQQLITTYDAEIARLDSAVTQCRSELDTNTVKIIEKNLVIIDKAIAESRAALAKDPHSRFLNDQLAHVLDQKVGLLRTAALLPTRT
jgi:hypothetical protein